MGNSFKGLGVIYKFNQENILTARDAGIELGFMLQFGIFSYILTAVLNTSKKEQVKEQLLKISQII